MIGLDTNILIRWITADDPILYKKAEQFLKKNQDNGFYCSIIVILEVWWVLKKVYLIPESEVRDVIQRLTNLRELKIEHHHILQKTLKEIDSTSADFEDLLISLIHLNQGADFTVTFDKKAGNLPGMQQL